MLCQKLSGLGALWHHCCLLSQPILKPLFKQVVLSRQYRAKYDFVEHVEMWTKKEGVREKFRSRYMTSKMYFSWATTSGGLTVREAHAEWARVEATPGWPTKTLGSVGASKIGYLMYMFDEVEGYKDEEHAIALQALSKRHKCKSEEDRDARIQALDYDHKHLSEFAGPGGFLAKQMEASGMDHGLNQLRKDEDTFDGEPGVLTKGNQKHNFRLLVR